MSSEPKPKNLAEALIAFQASVPTIHENDSSYHGKFANLPGVLSTINPALRSAGLVVSQLPEEINGLPGLRTTLMHTSGEQLSAVTPLTVNTGKNGTQEWGKAVTYSRRFALLAALNLAIGIEDQDADNDQQVSNAPTAKQPQVQLQQPADFDKHQFPGAVQSPEDPLTKDQKDLIIGVLKECSTAYRDKVLAAFVKEFGASKAKVSDRIQAVKHNTFFQSYFSTNPQ